MDEIKKLVGRLTDIWHVLVGVAGGILACWRVYAAHGHRVRRALLLSDAIHSSFGDEAAEDFLRDLLLRSKDSLIRESRIQLVEEKLGLAIYCGDASGNYEFVNHQFAELFGIDREGCLGYGWIDGVAGQERQRVHESWMYAVHNQLPYEGEYTVQNRRTGERIYCLTKAYPAVDGERRLVCYVGYVVRKRVIEEVKT